MDKYELLTREFIEVASREELLHFCLKKETNIFQGGEEANERTLTFSRRESSFGTTTTESNS